MENVQPTGMVWIFIYFLIFFFLLWSETRGSSLYTTDLFISMSKSTVLKYLKYYYFFFNKKTLLTFVCLVLQCYQLVLVEKE